MHCSQRRLLRKGLEVHVCTITKNTHTKNVWKLILWSLYIYCSNKFGLEHMIFPFQDSVHFCFVWMRNLFYWKDLSLRNMLWLTCLLKKILSIFMPVLNDILFILDLCLFLYYFDPLQAFFILLLFSFPLLVLLMRSFHNFYRCEFIGVIISWIYMQFDGTAIKGFVYKTTGKCRPCRYRSS